MSHLATSNITFTLGVGYPLWNLSEIKTVEKSTSLKSGVYKLLSKISEKFI